MTGLVQGTVVLQDNGTDTLTLNADGGATQSFTFGTLLADGQGYAVTATAQDPNLACAVDGGTGNIAASDVTTVAVSCDCIAGLSQCTDGCVDLTSDSNNCGSCNNVCQPQNGFTTSCSSSQCVCPSGRVAGAVADGSACTDDCDCVAGDVCDSSSVCVPYCFQYTDQVSCQNDLRCYWLFDNCVPNTQ